MINLNMFLDQLGLCFWLDMYLDSRRHYFMSTFRISWNKLIWLHFLTSFLFIDILHFVVEHINVNLIFSILASLWKVQKNHKTFRHWVWYKVHRAWSCKYHGYSSFYYLWYVRSKVSQELKSNKYMNKVLLAWAFDFSLQ